MKLKNPLRDARTVAALLTGAEAASHAAGEELPGAEHLLLSALELPDGTARRTFARVGADPDDLPRAIAAQHADALRAVGIDAPDEDTLGPGHAVPGRSGRVFRARPSAQAAFHAAVRLSKERRGGSLRGAHVVAAVAAMEHGTAPRALRAMGIDPPALAAAARAELDDSRA